jgi:FPC/CPF motif-containing protein YcgG
MAINPFGGSGPDVAGGLKPASHGGLLPSRLAAAADSFAEEAHSAFHSLVTSEEFPCVGARAAFNSESYVLATYGTLGADDSTAQLARDLFEFTSSELRERSEYATFVAVFGGPLEMDEPCFEELLWRQLQALNRLDAQHFDWDADTRRDPGDPQFSFSFAGQALYVIGMHPGSSRLARQFQWPALIFNPHEQFERLRTEGKWKRMQQTIRARDVALQGSVNPMLSDFGESSEARQYSGRAVEEDWRAPFKAANAPSPGKCPFGH